MTTDTETASRMDAFGGLAGAYLHTPFCAAICPYCDFAVVAGKDDLIERYCDAVVAEIGMDRPWRPLDAVYVGGGTPSRVPGHQLNRFLDALSSLHGINEAAEVTLEANPEDWTGEIAASFRAAGFNRVSFGAQSFDSSVLLSLGRRHGPDQIPTSVATARAEGFSSVSIDLIYGSPDESDRSWLATVEAAVAAGPDHVSCYALTVEAGTKLGRQVSLGAPAPDPDIQASRFAIADSILIANGLTRYEVSNWSRPGHECVYNSIVWAQGDYLAYGNGAHGFLDGVRSRNFRHLETYLRAVENRESPTAGEEFLTGWDLELDRIFVGLRRSAGVAVGPGGRVFIGDGDGQRLIEAGVVSVNGDRLKVENPMLTDEVLRVVLGLKVGEHGPDGDTLMGAYA
ncbi:MAG: radical SAM family heme chaperone HemW [Acidimicrobiia bacterium]